MKRIVFATGNKGKLREIREIMEGFEVVSMGELGLTAEAEETGSTFAENAFIKAREIYDKLLAVGDLRDTFVMADDSGLCIDALGGEPGVHSARFMGHDTDYHVKRMKLLEMLKDVPWETRGARFTASICMIRENGEAVTETASMENFHRECTASLRTE